jgi:hypothetical protein
MAHKRFPNASFVAELDKDIGESLIDVRVRTIDVSLDDSVSWQEWHRDFDDEMRHQGQTLSFPSTLLSILTVGLSSIPFSNSLASPSLRSSHDISHLTSSQFVPLP